MRILVFYFVVLAVLISCKDSVDNNVQITNNNQMDKNIEFEINQYSLKLSSLISKVTFVNNKYIIITSKNEFVCLDENFEINITLTDKLNQMKFSNVFFTNDSVFCVVNLTSQKVERFVLNEKLEWDLYKAKIPVNYNLYQDDKYVATSFSMGEFGGAVIFEEKSSAKKFTYPALNPIAVHLIENEYYIVSSLAHMSGFSAVYKTSAPNKLYEIIDSSINFNSYWVQQFNLYIGNQIKDIVQAPDTLLDVLDVLIDASFVRNGELFFISTDFQKTYLSKIENEKLVNIEEISTTPIWTYTPNIINLPDQMIFSSEKGFISVKSNKIDVIFLN
ncbi:MAG: hypothetical protein JXL97_02235 [Bacteroidales bacterium]|nr:hypothetical protein [Bacteroidales bacterium]